MSASRPSLGFIGDIIERPAVRMLERRHGNRNTRVLVPPALIFANTGSFRDVEFLGLAVPGAADLTSNDDLVAVWKQRQGKRFQNYQAKFTILNTDSIQRQWIEDIRQGNPLTNSCPLHGRHGPREESIVPSKHRASSNAAPNQSSCPGLKSAQSLKPYDSISKMMK